MGRGATKALGNPWYDARINASKDDERLSSREGAAELLGMSVSAVSDAELGLTKIMPVDKAVLMADLYNAPELLNYYCLNECPIGCRRAISDKMVDIEMATVKLTKVLRKDMVQRIKYALQDIAADGMVGEDEAEEFDRVVDDLREIAKIISELEIIRDRVKNRVSVKNREVHNGRAVGKI